MMSTAAAAVLNVISVPPATWYVFSAWDSVPPPVLSCIRQNKPVCPATSSLAAGDIIFPMIKETGGTGSTIYMNLSIQTTTF